MPYMMSVVFLVIACGVAALAYRESESFKRKNGVTPWHWPSWVWALLGLLSLVLCAVLLVIARRRTKPLQTAAFLPPTSSGLVPGFSPQSALDVESYPTMPSPAVGPSWHQDPTGRFASRFWDGSQWTQHVSDGNATASDPLPV